MVHLGDEYTHYISDSILLSNEQSIGAGVDVGHHGCAQPNLVLYSTGRLDEYLSGGRALANETILVVDDNREIAAIVTEHILRPSGYQVILARDGIEGLQRIEADMPDLVLLDMEMPRLDGMGVLDALQAKKCDIPIILMTSHGSEQLAVTVFRKGVRDYVIKPADSAELLAVVERALTEVRLRREKEDLTNHLVAANQELERRVKELNALYGIGRSVTSLLELDRLLSRVVEAAVYITGAEEGEPAPGR